VKFSIGIVGLGTNPHSRCFFDFARALAAALRRMGHEVAYADMSKPETLGRLIIFGGGNTTDPGNLLPRDTIIFNAEQLVAVENPGAFLQNHEGYKNFVVWDYASVNVEELRKLGIQRAVHCPVGYVPEMTLPWSSQKVDKDIDVLHYGSVNARRREILDKLDAAGLKVVQLFNVYDAERDLAIARSKVVLNLHFYPRGIFEIFRCSHLFANRACVVTEDGGVDEELERLAYACARRRRRDQIVDECRRLVGDDRIRVDAAERGHEAFKKYELVAFVDAALERSIK
jgi:hypothetical protein